MKVEFAPINIPLKRRIQTVAVLQWIFSFLLLGNSLPPFRPCPREKRERIGFFPGQRHPWASVWVTLWLHTGAEVAWWRVAPRLSLGGKSIALLGLGLLFLESFGWIFLFLWGLFLSVGSFSNTILKS